MNWYKKSQLVKLPKNIHSEVNTILAKLKQLISSVYPELPPLEPIMFHIINLENPYSKEYEDIRVYLNNENMSDSGFGFMLDGKIYINYAEGIGKDFGFSENKILLQNILYHELTHIFDKQLDKNYNKNRDLNYNTSPEEFRATLREVYEEFKDFYVTLNKDEQKEFLRWIASNNQVPAGMQYLNFANVNFEYNGKNFILQDPISTTKLRVYERNNYNEKLNKIRWVLYKHLQKL